MISSLVVCLAKILIGLLGLLLKQLQSALKSLVLCQGISTLALSVLVILDMAFQLLDFGLQGGVLVL